MTLEAKNCIHMKAKKGFHMYSECKFLELMVMTDGENCTDCGHYQTTHKPSDKVENYLLRPAGANPANIRRECKMTINLDGQEYTVVDEYIGAATLLEIVQNIGFYRNTENDYYFAVIHQA